MKKILFFLIAIFLVLYFCNSRYPFWTNRAGGWTVGFNTVNSIESTMRVSDSNFVTSKYLNTLNTKEHSIFLADPFYIIEKDTAYLFVENLLSTSTDARIDVFATSDYINFDYKGIALDEDFHLSYPQVFKHDGEFYMIPETKQADNVLLYSTTNLPFDWKVVDTLIKNVNYKDPTLLIKNDKFYLFTVDDDLELYIYTSNNINGPWEINKNHTKLKGNEARPGGRIFEYDNSFYLPMQNLSEGYGTGVSLYSIVITDDRIDLKKTHPMFLSKEKKIDVFNKGMHHVDIQMIGDSFFVLYDGQSKAKERDFNWKRTIKYNLLDFKLWQ
jgi:hypothetical protein